MQKKILIDYKILIGDIPEHKIFFCNNGEIFRNINDLSSSLKLMDKKTFNFHVNSQKNDFSNWIYDTIGDIDLSNKIRNISDQKEIYKKIKTRITYIKNKIKNSS